MVAANIEWCNMLFCDIVAIIHILSTVCECMVPVVPTLQIFEGGGGEFCR